MTPSDLKRYIGKYIELQRGEGQPPIRGIALDLHGGYLVTSSPAWGQPRQAIQLRTISSVRRIYRSLPRPRP